MSEYDGVIRVQHEVHCRRCEKPVLGLGSDRAKAERELRMSYQWHRIRGKWFCADCAPDVLEYLSAVESAKP